MGKNGLQKEACHGNLNNIPRSAHRGKVEFILYQNFQQCQTKLSRVTADELTGSDEINDFKYTNTIYFNSHANGEGYGVLLCKNQS